MKTGITLNANSVIVFMATNNIKIHIKITFITGILKFNLYNMYMNLIIQRYTFPLGKNRNLFSGTDRETI